MPEFSLRTVRISLAIMTLSGYLALATTEAFGPEIAIVPIALVAAMRFFERLDARSAAYRRVSQSVTIVFTILVVPYLFFNLISGLTAIVLYVQAYLILHGKGVKEYKYLFLMAFFLLVDAAAQSPDSGFGLVVPVFVFSAVWAFATVQIYAETEANKNGNIADLLPAEYRRGFLPPEVLQWIRGERRDQMSVGPVLAGVSIGCIVVTLVLFLLTPRIEAGVFGRSNLVTNVQRSGLDSGVNIAAGGTIATDEAPVFLARFPDEPTGKPEWLTDGLYWRVTSYNRLIGSEWDRLAVDFDYVFWRGRGGRLDREAPEVGRRVVQEIFLQDAQGLPGVPALPGVYRLRSTANAAAIFAQSETDPMTIVITESVGESVSYRAESRVPNWTPAQLRAKPPQYRMDLESRIAMQKHTDNRISEEAKLLAKSLTDGLETPYDKALAIQTYLKDPSNYSYSTSLESLSTVDPIHDFLFIRKHGHCELFASAMCMMLRSVGVPARVASGFRDGDWSEDDGGFIVRRRHAHLWVEVYLDPEIGWCIFDPSGEADPNDTFLAALQRVLGRYLLMARFMYYRDIIGYSSGIQLSDIADFSMGLIQFDVELMRTSLPSLKSLSTGLPAIVISLFVGVAIVWGFVLMYRSAALRRKTGAGLVYSADQARATRLYVRLRRRVATLGTDAHGIGARELVHAVESNPSIDAATVSRIVRAYNETRFGGRPMDKRSYEELARAVRLVKRDARARQPSLAEQ
ncbi:MAG: DUF3488 domain-containing protein [Candidatus Hydrogenedentes bacterium]|nr:DUF3488 domain-containing protein [Candidatus Hydrogenedentota bacterium]